MRLIDADALKKNINNSVFNATDRMRVAEKLLFEIIARCFLAEIDKGPTVMQPWVTCEERLPEEDGEYIVTFVSNSGSRYTTVAKYLSNIKRWVAFYGKVVAWMPKPEPWKPDFVKTANLDQEIKKLGKQTIQRKE